MWPPGRVHGFIVNDTVLSDVCELTMKHVMYICMA